MGNAQQSVSDERPDAIVENRPLEADVDSREIIIRDNDSDRVWLLENPSTNFDTLRRQILDLMDCKDVSIERLQILYIKTPSRWLDMDNTATLPQEIHSIVGGHYLLSFSVFVDYHKNVSDYNAPKEEAPFTAHQAAESAARAVSERTPHKLAVREINDAIRRASRRGKSHEHVLVAVGSREDSFKPDDDIICYFSQEPLNYKIEWFAKKRSTDDQYAFGYTVSWTMTN